MLLDLDAIFDPDRYTRRSRTAIDSPSGLAPDWYVLWDERAAIMEFEGGMPRELAEHFALLDVIGRMKQVPMMGT
jgi:hypothetical protein